MRQIFTIVIFLATSIAAFSQQAATQGASNRPTSAQTKESASQYLKQGRTNSSQFDSIQASLTARNTSNDDATAYSQLKDEIDKLESSIREEQNRISATLDRGIKVNQETLDRVQKLIDKHKAKLAELESFASAK